MSIESNDKAVARKYMGGKAPTAYYAFRDINKVTYPPGPAKASAA